MPDLKFAFRQLLKSPGFSAVAVLTLGQRAAAADTTDASELLPVPQAIVARRLSSRTEETARDLTSDDGYTTSLCDSVTLGEVPRLRSG